MCTQIYQTLNSVKLIITFASVRVGVASLMSRQLQKTPELVKTMTVYHGEMIPDKCLVEKCLFRTKEPEANYK